MLNVYLSKKISWNNGYVCFITQIIANVAFYARDTIISKFRKIVFHINDNRIVVI